MVENQRSRQPPTRNSGLVVVGVGASAGGLEAFTSWLKALPTNTGMAFVLVQHMDPNHESMLSQLLSKATTMPVAEVKDRTPLKGNHVYVIPPNKDLSLDGKMLRLGRLRSGHMPIDSFFSSLAKERREKAIGVVLSGTGSDGTEGMRAIKDLGGITFAQDRKSAKYTGMPTNAAASGNADFVLPPPQIARKLRRLARDFQTEASEPDDKLRKEAKSLETVFRLLREATDADFSQYKPANIKRRIRRRMLLLDIPELDRYAEYLRKHPAEIRDLFESILIPVTSFFREPKKFQALQDRVFPQLAANARKTKSIRIWVAGCSTGEEVYSLAITLLEYLADEAARIRIQIFGTDLNERAIQIARTGVYAKSSVESVSRDRLNQFFTKLESGYQIAKWIREMCIFARHDLSKDPPFAGQDLISCQNVLIYFGPALQKHILASFQYALKPTGYLLLGKPEAPSGYADFFTLEDRTNKLFSPKPNVFRLGMSKRLIDQTDTSEAGRPAAPVVEDARQLLLERYAPPAFLVDSDWNILYFQGDTNRFIKLTGPPSFRLLKMLRSEFVMDVRALLHQAKKGGKPVGTTGIMIEGAIPPRRIAIDVAPIDTTGLKSSNFMVVFREMTPELPKSRTHLKDGKGHDYRREVEAIRRELAAARVSLKSMIEEQEAANEELKTANEEILSSNEELSSTNEELETAKEALQSGNQELTTLNEELQSRNLELSTFADDLSSLLTGTNIPVLILDRGRKIQRFTPAAQREFNLKPADIGRQFGEISSNLAAANWDELISRVTDQSRNVEEDVAGRNGRWYSLRMRPYKNQGSRADGILVALIDVDHLKSQLRDVEGSLRASQGLYRLIADSTTDLVALHSTDSKYVYVSPSREKLLGYSAHDIIGKVPADFCHPDDRKSLALAFKKAAQSGNPVESTYRVITKARKELWFEIRISPIKDRNGKVTSLQSSSRNVTERKLADNKIRESEFTVRTLLETTPQGVLVVNSKGKIVLANQVVSKIFGYRKLDLIDRPLLDLIPKGSRKRYKKDQTDFFRNPTPRSMGVGLNVSGLAKSGKEFPVEIELSSIEVNRELLAVAYVTDISKRKQTEEALQESHDRLLALSSSLMTSQDEASRQLSRELHDVFSQELAALATESRLLKRDLPHQATRAAKRIEDVAHRIGRLATDMHNMSRRLHPAILDELGLQAALRAECNAFSQLHRIHTFFNSKQVPESIKPDIALCLYRVTQESLRNIAKHSGTKTVRIELAMKKGELHLAIEDFGRGFDFRAHGRKKLGLGLISMEERVRLVGGTLSVDSKAGRGTRILARIPLSAPLSVPLSVRLSVKDKK